MNALKRIAPPAIIFFVLLALLLLVEPALPHAESPAWAAARGALPRALAFLTWIGGAVFANALLDVFFWDGFVARVSGAAAPRLLVQLSSLLVYGAALVGFVGYVLGRSVGGLLAASGAVGVVVAIALRSLILDAFSGIAIAIDRPFQVGDLIQVHGRGSARIMGFVHEVNWRTTWLKTPESTIMVIPNSEIGASTITNYSRPTSVSDFEHVITFDFALEPERVIRVIEAGLRSAAQEGLVVRDPPPVARVTGFDGVGMQIKVIWSVDSSVVSPPRARHGVLLRIMAQLRRAGIEPATPRVDNFNAPMPDRSFDHDQGARRAALLRTIDLFRPAGPAAIEALAERIVPRALAPGEILIREGEPGDSLFVLAEGFLTVEVTDSTGAARKLDPMSPGELVGELSLLTGEPRSATVAAESDVVIYEITRADMQRLIDGRSEIARRVADVAAERRLRQRAHLAGDGGIPAARRNLAREILDQMRGFFGDLLRPTRGAVENTGRGIPEAEIKKPGAS